MLVARSLAVLALGTLVACPGTIFSGHRTMGEACDDSDQCAEGGTCLAGVCEGYACEQDADCDGGHLCADIGGVKACALPCGSTADCGGQQECREQDAGGWCL